MIDITKKVATYVKERGISMSFICEKTGLSKNVVYPSLCEGATRKLRVDEFFIICKVIGADPSRLVAFDTDQPDQAS